MQFLLFSATAKWFLTHSKCKNKLFVTKFDMGISWYHTRQLYNLCTCDLSQHKLHFGWIGNQQWRQQTSSKLKIVIWSRLTKLTIIEIL